MISFYAKNKNSLQRDSTYSQHCEVKVALNAFNLKKKCIHVLMENAWACTPYMFDLHALYIFFSFL